MHAGEFGWSSFKLNLLTVFSTTGVTYLLFLKKPPGKLGICHKLIRPDTPRHSGKVERSHREDQNDFIPVAVFSLDDFAKQLSLQQALQ